MPNQKPTLDYARALPGFPQRRVATTLSLVIGIGVTAASACVFWAVTGYDALHSFILGLAFHDHLVFVLPPLAIIGIVIGIIALTKNPSVAAAFGLALSGSALLASMVVIAVYFFAHIW